MTGASRGVRPQYSKINIKERGVHTGEASNKDLSRLKKKRGRREGTVGLGKRFEKEKHLCVCAFLKAGIMTPISCPWWLGGGKKHIGVEGRERKGVKKGLARLDIGGCAPWQARKANVQARTNRGGSAISWKKEKKKRRSEKRPSPNMGCALAAGAAVSAESNFLKVCKLHRGESQPKIFISEGTSTKRKICSENGSVETTLCITKDVI